MQFKHVIEAHYKKFGSANAFKFIYKETENISVAVWSMEKKQFVVYVNDLFLFKHVEILIYH